MMRIGLLAAFVFGVVPNMMLAAGIRNVTASQRWPWNGTVGIRYEVDGELPQNVGLVVMATDKTKNVSYPAVFDALTGETGRNEGAHHVVWNLEKQGLNLQSSEVVFSVTYAGYCVVDLSGGADASSYPVTWMYSPPNGGFNTDEYKTTKLVLRRIELGTFTMGSPSTELGRESNETLHKVTLEKPFYMGLFEITQKQWELVAGGNPSSATGDMRPVEQVSYEMIRGRYAGAKWPATNTVDAGSFIERLRSRTGLEFDLPTEAQWEYSCRAGTTTALNSGKNLTATNRCVNVAEVGRYAGNVTVGNGGYTNRHTKVGSYLPNAWGLYDMHGNVEEWCLDWYAESLASSEVTEPTGPTVGTNRVFRSGGWNHDAAFCRSAHRGNAPARNSYNNCGFRLVCTVGL